MSCKPLSTKLLDNGKCTLFKRVISWFVILFTVVIAGIYLSRPFYDPDFYWHLKTGQWIWQNKTLPYSDPFGVPPLPEPTAQTEFILTSYWLDQLALYAFYSLGGMPGIIVFRWILAGIAFLVCAYWTKICDVYVTAVIALGSILLFEYFYVERPQFVSFVCFGALLVILFRFFEQKRDRSLWSLLVPLSLLMVVWANMHGGFFIGQSILLYCVVVEGAKFLHPMFSPLSLQNYRILLISSTTALIVSFINPNYINELKILPTIIGGNEFFDSINREYASLIVLFKRYNHYTLILYMVSMLLTASALLASRHRKNITWIGILAATSFMGSQHLRLVPFFLVSATIFVTKFFETEYKAFKGRLVLLAMLAVASVYCVGDEFSLVLEAARSRWVPISHYPVKAADFIINNNLGGYIYTTHYWGSYMIWRVAPENKIFLDGRGLNTQRIWEDYKNITMAVNQGPYLKSLYHMYDIRVFVLPIFDDPGKLNMLTRSISVDKEWKKVFSSGNEVIFVRNDLSKNKPGSDQVNHMKYQSK